MTFILGLTGSIASGKTTTAGFFKEYGVPVFDADATVHRLYQDKAVPVIQRHFSQAVINGVVDRKRLSEIILHQPEKLKQLEALIHPLVQTEEEHTRQTWTEQGKPIGIIDSPLLLETGGQQRCDAVALVIVMPDIQKQRVLARPGMDEEKFNALLKKQMPDNEKRKQAHFLIDTGRGMEAAQKQVKDILRCLSVYY